MSKKVKFDLQKAFDISMSSFDLGYKKAIWDYKEFLKKEIEKFDIGVAKTIGKSYFCRNCSCWVVKKLEDCKDLTSEVKQNRVRVSEKLYERCRRRIEDWKQLKQNLGIK